MSNNEHLLRRYPDLIAPDSDPDLIQTVHDLDAASSSARALQPPAALVDTIDKMTREHRASHQQGRSAAAPRLAESGSDPFLPQHHTPPTGIPTHRTEKGWLRQSLELAAAVVAMLLVTAVLVAVFRNSADESAGNQAAPIMSPTSPPTTPVSSPAPTTDDLQTVEDVLTAGATMIDLTRILELGKDGQLGRVVSVQRMRLGDALVQANWASQDLSRQDDPDESVWEIELANIQVGHSCPIGSTPEQCNWDHLIWVIHATTGETIGLRYPDTVPPPIRPEAQLRTVEDAIARAHDLVPGREGQDARIVGIWLLTAAEADLGEGWDASTPIWQVEMEGGGQVPGPCSAPQGVDPHCPADHLMLHLHAVTGDFLGYRLIEPVPPALPDASTPPAVAPSPSPHGIPVSDLPEDAALRSPDDAGASALHWANSILQGHDAVVVSTSLVTVSVALTIQEQRAGSTMQVWDTTTYDVPVWIVELEGSSFHRYDCDACPTGRLALLTIRAQDEALYWAAVGPEEMTSMTQVIPDLPENISSAEDVTIEEMTQYAISYSRNRGMIESDEPEVLLATPATAAGLHELGLGFGPVAETCQRPFFVVILRGDFSGDYQYIGYVFDQASGAPGDTTLEIQSPDDEPFREALGGEPVIPPVTASPEAWPEPPSIGICEDTWV